MNNREVINRLREDIFNTKTELPPISEKVRLAVRAQKQKYIEYTNQTAVSDTRRHYAPGILILAALLTGLVVSVPIIIAVSGSSTKNDKILSGNIAANSLTDQGTSDNSKAVIAADKGTLEHIKTAEQNGPVLLSSRSVTELETILESYSTKNSVYEDNVYLYNFAPDGKLIEILRTDIENESHGEPVRRQYISEKAAGILKEYFPDFDDESCQTDIDGDTDRMSAWCVEYTLKNDDISVRKLIMTFDGCGNMLWACYSGNSSDQTEITRSEAIQIALNELRSGKYDALPFSDEDITVIVDNAVIEVKNYYSVLLEKVPYDNSSEDVIFSSFIFLVDSETGKISLRDSSIAV